MKKFLTISAMFIIIIAIGGCAITPRGVLVRCTPPDIVGKKIMVVLESEAVSGKSILGAIESAVRDKGATPVDRGSFTTKEQPAHDMVLKISGSVDSYSPGYGYQFGGYYRTYGATVTARLIDATTHEVIAGGDGVASRYATRSAAYTAAAYDAMQKLYTRCVPLKQNGGG